VHGTFSLDFHKPPKQSETLHMVLPRELLSTAYRSVAESKNDLEKPLINHARS
jgi:hypothetical protein